MRTVVLFTRDLRVHDHTPGYGSAARFVAAARLCRDIGCDFIDLKQCHRYLLSELLAARQRPGDFGGPRPEPDEFDALERNVLLTVLSRIGQNSRVVLTHDVAQRDNLRVGRHDGVASVIETLKGQSLFGHITLTRSERSAIAALVTDLLESNELA